MAAKGRLIVFEGIDGAGGDTQARKLADHLSSQNRPVHVFHFPNYERPTGQLISAFLDRKHDFAPEIQMLLYGADFAVDFSKIRELLAAGTTVIADRYVTSTLAWQSSLGVPVEKILKLLSVIEAPKPDLVIVLKLDAKTSIDRKLKENAGFDRFESNEKLLDSVSKTYLSLARKKTFCRKWAVVDASKGKDEVAELVRKAVGEK